MVGKERWAEIRRQHFELGRSISAIARQMELDRKTVRRCIRDEAWRPYQRRAEADTLLGPHAGWLRRRAPEVRYSARILNQELEARHGYRGSYETVKRFVAPLRELAASDALTQTGFETAPRQQSQMDRGQIELVRIWWTPGKGTIFPLGVSDKTTTIHPRVRARGRAASRARG